MTHDEKPYCTCLGGREGFRADDDDPDLWVHVGCGKPTKMFLEGYLHDIGFYDPRPQAPAPG